MGPEDSPLAAIHNDHRALSSVGTPSEQRVACGVHVHPSDTGIAGARPLPPIEWMPGAPIGDAEWSAQNRKINDLLMGRAG